MSQLTVMHLFGAILTLGLFSGLGIWSGRKIRGMEDFATGGRAAGPLVVAGGILGTLVGGSSTVGTAQLAMTYGFSGVWYTLGAALGCVAMALWFADPIRRSGQTTVQGVIHNRYGPQAGLAVSLLSGVGLIANIVSQMLSATALLSAIFGLGSWGGALAGVVLMSCYVLWGGIQGAGLLGVCKMILLYLVSVAAGLGALAMGGGLPAFYQQLDHAQYFSLFARGLAVDGGAALSAVLGFLSTQSYLQMIASSRSLRAAKTGALLSALLAPPIGILCVFVGQYMVLNHPETIPGQALPGFILTYMPPLAAGIALAALLIAVVGTGAGMALGFGTMVTRDIYSRFIRPGNNGAGELRMTRIVMLCAFGVGALMAVYSAESPILSWGFLSMGLRAAAVFFPLCGALFYPGRIAQGYVVASGVLGLGVMLACRIGGLSIDPLLPGMLTAGTVMAWGVWRGRRMIDQ